MPPNRRSFRWECELRLSFGVHQRDVIFCFGFPSKNNFEMVSKRQVLHHSANPPWEGVSEGEGLERENSGDGE